MSVTFADAGETVSRQCFEVEAYSFLPAHPEPAETGSFPHVGTSRCARRRRSRLKSAHGRETVSAQCLPSRARTQLTDIFNILAIIFGEFQT